MKERRKHKKFNIKRTLTYLATYIVVTFGVALFMVMSSTTTLSSGNKFNFTIPEPSAIEKVIASITESENIEINALVDVEGNEGNVASLTAGVNLQFGEEISDIKADVSLVVSSGESEFGLRGVYVDDTLFVDINNAKYKLSVSSAMQAVGEVTKLFDIDIDALLSSLDTSKLGDMIGDVQEVQGGYLLKLDINGIVINMYTDSSYNLTQVKIDKITLGDYAISVVGNVVGRNNGKDVVVPDGEYTDISDMFDIVSSVASSINGRYFKASIEGDGIAFDGYINVADLSMYGTLSVKGVDINIVEVDGIVYIDAYGVKVKADLRDYSQYLQLLEYFDVSLDFDISQVLETLSNFDFNIITGVQKTDSGITLGLNILDSAVDVEFGLNDNILEYISTSLFGFDVNVDCALGYAELPAVEAGEYIDAVSLIQFVPAVVDIVNHKGVGVELEINAFDTTLDVVGCLTFDEGLKAQFSTNVFGFDVLLTLVDNNIYVSVDGIKAVTNIDDIMQVLDIFGVELDTQDISVTLTENNGKITASIFGIAITAYAEDSVIYVDINGGNISASAKAQSYAGDITLDTQEYESVDIVNIATQVKKLIDNKQIELNLDLTVADIDVSVSGVVDFDGALRVHASVLVMEHTLTIDLQDGMIYVAIDDGAKLKGALSELPKLIEDIKAVFDSGNTNTLSHKSRALSASNTLVGGIDLSDIKLKLSNGTIYVQYKDILSASVDISKDVVDSLKVTYQDIDVNINVNLGTDEVVQDVANVESYNNNFENLLPAIVAVKKIIDTKVLYAIVNVKAFDITTSLEVVVDRTQDLRVSVKGSIKNYDFELLYDGNVYISALGMNYYLTDCDIHDLLGALQDIINIDLSQINITSFYTDSAVVIASINDSLNIYANITDGVIVNTQVDFDNIHAKVYWGYDNINSVKTPDIAHYTRLMGQFDLVNLVELIRSAINESKVALSGYAIVDNNQIDYAVHVEFGEQLKACASLSFKGYEVRVYVCDGTIYINACDMAYLYLDMSDISEVLDTLTQMFGLSVDIDAIINMVVNNIQYVTVDNNIVQFVKDNVIVNARVFVPSGSVESVPNAYRYTNNVADLIPFVSAIKNIVESTSFGAKLRLDINEKEYLFNVQYEKLNDTFAVMLSGAIAGKDVSVIYTDGTLYLDVFGYKASFDVDSDSINDVIIQVLDMLDMEYHDTLKDNLDMLLDKFDLNFDNIISNFVLSHNTLGVTIAQKVDVEIGVQDDVITLVDIKYGDSIGARIEVNYNAHAHIEIGNSYDNLNGKLDVLKLVKKIMATYDSVVEQYTIDGEQYTGYNLSFDAAVRFGNINPIGRVQLSVVPTKTQDGVENKIYASVHGSINNTSADIYLVDNTLYVKVLGLKLQLELSKDNLESIISWASDTFGLEINLSLDSLGSGLDIDIKDLSTFAFDASENDMHAYLGEFRVNTSRFTDIDLDIQASSVLNKILIGTTVFDSNMTEIGDAQYDNLDWETAYTANKTLAMMIYNLSYGEFVDDIMLGDQLKLSGERASEYVDIHDFMNFVSYMYDYIMGGKYAFTLNTTVTEFNPSTSSSRMYAKVDNAFFELSNSPLKDALGNVTQGINIDYLYANGKFTLPNTAKNATSDYLTHKVEATLDSGKIYATYSNSMSNYSNNLKLKISKSTLLKFGAIILKVFDFDTSILTNNHLLTLPDVSAMDVTNLQYLFDVEPVDNTDFEALNDMLSTVFAYTDDITSIDFVSSKVMGADGTEHVTYDLVLNIVINDEVMTLTLNMSDGKLYSVRADNVQVTRTRNMNLTLDVTDFIGTNRYNKSASHFDLDGLDDLITSFVNNSNSDYYHVSGTINVNINIPLIKFFSKTLNFDLNVPFNVYVRLVETTSASGRTIKKPQVLVKASIPIVDIPVISLFLNINDDMDSGADSHELNVYYYDGMMYTYRTESKSSTVYEKAVLQAATDVDILEYVQYVSGLSDTIMEYINEAMEKTFNRTNPIDVTNTIKNYLYSASGTTGKHNIIVNLEELANNDMLDTGTVNVYTGIVSGDRYITNADINLFMPVKANIVEITIKSNDKAIKLDFGSNLAGDVNSAINNALSSSGFVKTLNTWGADKYIERTGSASSATWKKASDIVYTISFNTLNDAVSTPSSISGTVGTPISLPTSLSSNTKTATIDGVTYKYRFDGWSQDTLGEGDKVTWTTLPRGNKTLYARWIVTEVYTTTYYYLDGQVIYSEQKLAGTALKTVGALGLNATRTVYSADGRIKYEQSNPQITDAKGNAVYVFGSTNQNVYVTYNTDNTKYLHNISIHTGVAPQVDAITAFDSENYMARLPQYEGELDVYYEAEKAKLTYAFAGWYMDEDFAIACTDPMPNEDIDVYAKWVKIREVRAYTLTIYDNGAIVYQAVINQGESITLPSNIKVDGSTQWFLDAGYGTQTSFEYTMPTHDVTVHIRNKYTLTYTYYTISNHASMTSSTKTITSYQGTGFTLPTQANDYVDYKNSSNVLDYRMYYTFTGYKDGNNTFSVMQNHNCTLVSTYTSERKNYYTISFDMTLNYIPKSCAAGTHYKSTPSTPASLRLLEGSVIDLTQSKYQITVEIWATAFSFGVKYKYKSTTWGTAKHKDYSDGGDGVTSWTVTGNATLRPYWKKQ